MSEKKKKATAGVYYTKTGTALTVINGGGQGDGRSRAQLYLVPNWYTAPTVSSSNIVSVRKQLLRIDQLIAQLRASGDLRLRGQW